MINGKKEKMRTHIDTELLALYLENATNKEDLPKFDDLEKDMSLNTIYPELLAERWNRGHLEVIVRINKSSGILGEAYHIKLPPNVSNVSDTLQRMWKYWYPTLFDEKGNNGTNNTGSQA